MVRLIAETKTLKIEMQILNLYLREFNDYLLSLNFGIKKLNTIIPKFKNIDFWFEKETQSKLARTKEFINNIKDEKVQKFFLVAFSETVRESSLTRNSEFKLYRMSEKQREKFNPDVFGIISSKLARCRCKSSKSVSHTLFEFLLTNPSTKLRNYLACYSIVGNIKEMTAL